MTPSVIVFDVNETLLDIGWMRPGFVDAVGDGDLLAPWFSLMVRNSMVSALTNCYQPFPEQGVAALLTVAASSGIAVTEAQARSVVALMDQLPPHPDVIPALQRLHRAGLRLGTLTNNPPWVADRQLDGAGLSPLLEHRLSAHSVRSFKPAPAPYLHAAESFGVEIGELCLVAAHDWDVTGAIRAGGRGAFVARRGAAMGPLSAVPDVIGADLGEIADHLLLEEGGSLIGPG